MRFTGTTQLIEMVLKDRAGLETLIRRTELQPLLIPRLLTIAIASFSLFGVALAAMIAAAGVAPQLAAIEDVLRDGGPLVRFEPETVGLLGVGKSTAAIIAAYAFGLIAASGVCLPSLYVYGLLSGIRLSMLDVVTHAVKAKAAAAVALVGILPVYIAIGMGALVFDVFRGPLLEAALWLGLVLPFIAGLWGTVSLFRGFLGLTETLPPERCERRHCFLRRLVASWCACYTAVAPVMVYTVWQALQ